VEKFLKKYFPESKTAEGKAAISSFHQFLDESFVEAMSSKVILMMPKNQESSKIQRFKNQDSRIIKIKIQESREDSIKISTKKVFQNIE